MALIVLIFNSYFKSFSKIIDLLQIFGSEGNSLPAGRSSPKSGKDQFEARLLVEEARDHFGPPTLFQEAAFNEIGGADLFTQPNREF